MQEQNSKSSAASHPPLTSDSRFPSGQPKSQKCTVRYHDEEQNVTYSIELALSYEKTSSSSLDSNVQPEAQKNSSTPKVKASISKQRKYDLSLSVEILSWNLGDLYSRVFENESWEANVV